VRVHLDAAAAAMRAWRYIREVPTPPSAPGRHPVGFYRTGDGRWLFLHRLAQHHFVRQLRVLGLPESADDSELARAIGEWDGAALEEAVMAADACAAVARTSEEWAQHPHGRAVAELPLFSIRKIGDSAPEPAGSGDRPLGGIRVLDLTRVLAGPTSARALAEQGAKVLRIASPLYPDTPQMVKDTGHGKRSAVLDLRTSPGAETMRTLLAGADVYIQGYRPGAIEQLGFSADEVAALRPGAVVVRLSAFGGVGPWGRRRGFDSVVQAANGTALEMGAALGDGTPRSMPGNPLDYVTGYLAAFLVQRALERRAEEGGSYLVELSLAQTGHFLSRLPRLDREAAAARPAELSPERLDELMMTRQTPYGALRYLRPVAELPVTRARWDLPTVPVDHDRPQWW
jgi:crotonobetainyl-CoA:carnitine CoA-transferase CaiB-like acyl-CoA transferase